MLKKSAPEKNGVLTENDSFLKSLSMKFIAASVLSMFALYAASLANTALAGRFLGEDALAAVSLVNPVSLVYYTVGAVIGIGGSLAASRILGRGNYRDYRRLFSCASALMLAAAALMTAVGFLLLEPLSALLSGSAGNVALVRDYLRFYLPGGGFTLLAYVPLYFLKVDGRPKVSSALFFLSSGLSVALTWLFTGPVCRMGIGGASLSVTISMAVTAALGFAVLCSGSSELRLTRGGVTAANLRAIVSAGVPNGLTNLLEAARILFVNVLLMRLGASYLLTSYTVVRSIADLLGALTAGFSSALLPLFGVFFGERDYVHVRGLLRTAERAGLVLMCPLTVLVMAFPDAASALFGVTSPAVLAETRWALPLACAGTLFSYVNVLLAGYFTAIKRTWLADLLISLRLLIYLVLFAPPLAALLGSRGVWLSFSLAELAATLTFLCVRAAMRRKKPALDSFLLDTSLEGSVDITFSVRSRVEDIVAASEQISGFCRDNGIPSKTAMKVSLAVEELLTVIITRCMDGSGERYVDLRVCKLDREVMMRIRNMGKIFDPVSYYEQNKGDPDKMEELLGLKMMISSASLIEFRTTFGINNLLIIF